MHKLAAAALLGLAAASLSACCSSSEARFWEVRDVATGRTAYTVDTAGVPFEDIAEHFVDPSGRSVRLDAAQRVRQLSEAEYTTATSGAGYGISYCPERKKCWGMPHAK